MQIEESWSEGTAYEAYVGRWSREVARRFVAWLDVAQGRRWLDVGCGTGALSEAILEAAEPRAVVGVDQSRAYVDAARSRMKDPRASFLTARAEDLPAALGVFDAVVSGLVLNFVPQAGRTLGGLVRVVRPGGVVAAYVWDYAGEMQLMRHFWDAAVELFPDTGDLDEGVRFAAFGRDGVATLFAGAALVEVEATGIVVPTRFRDFDDYWRPFEGGQGPAPSFAMALDDADRVRLRERIRSRLPIGSDGSIELVARAWAVRARRAA